MLIGGIASAESVRCRRRPLKRATPTPPLDHLDGRTMTSSKTAVASVSMQPVQQQQQQWERAQVMMATNEDRRIKSGQQQQGEEAAAVVSPEQGHKQVAPAETPRRAGQEANGAVRHGNGGRKQRQRQQDVGPDMDEAEAGAGKSNWLGYQLLCGFGSGPGSLRSLRRTPSSEQQQSNGAANCQIADPKRATGPKVGDRRRPSKGLGNGSVNLGGCGDTDEDGEQTSALKGNCCLSLRSRLRASQHRPEPVVVVVQPRIRDVRRDLVQDAFMDESRCLKPNHLLQMIVNKNHEAPDDDNDDDDDGDADADDQKSPLKTERQQQQRQEPRQRVPATQPTNYHQKDLLILLGSPRCPSGGGSGGSNSGQRSVLAEAAAERSSRKGSTRKAGRAEKWPSRTEERLVEILNQCSDGQQQQLQLQTSVIDRAPALATGPSGGEQAAEKQRQIFQRRQASADVPTTIAQQQLNLEIKEESWTSFVRLDPYPRAISNASSGGDGGEQQETSTEADVEQHHSSSMRYTRAATEAATSILNAGQQDAIWELLTTEVFYIKRLKVIIELFLATLTNLQQHGFLSEIDPERMSSNIYEVYQANCSFWIGHLEPMLSRSRSSGCPLDPTMMRDVFVQIRDTFNPYYRYCLDHAHCLKYVKQQMEINKQFEIYLMWCESQKECQRLRFKDLLAEPMQRLTKYSLLLEAIEKKTAEQAQKEALEQMLAHMRKFVVTVNLELRRQDELDRLETTARRIDSYDIGGSDVYNDEIDRLVKSYCQFDITAALFNCPFRCHRQLLFDSQFLTRNTKFGQLKFKDSQASSKMDIVLLIFTDHLFICKQQATGSGTKWHHGALKVGQSSWNSLTSAAAAAHHRPSATAAAATANQTTNSGPESSTRSATKAPSPANGAAGGSTYGSTLALNNMGSLSGSPQHFLRPRTGSHCTMALHNSLIVHHQPNSLAQAAASHHHLSPRTYSLILPTPQAAGGANGPQTSGDQEQAVAASGSNLGSSSQEGSPLRQPQQQQPPRFHHASTSSLLGKAAREAFARSSNNSCDVNSKSADFEQRSEGAADQRSQQPLSTPHPSYHHHHGSPSHQAPSQSGGGAGGESHLRVIRSPYPVERLVMHELKDGRGVFFCQLNDSLTVANSFIIYISSSPSATTASGATAGSAIATDSAGQRQQQQQQQVNRSRMESRSDSEGRSHQNSVSSLSTAAATATSGATPTSAATNKRRSSEVRRKTVPVAPTTQPISPARQLINLIEQAQVRYQIAANFHGINIPTFCNPLDDENYTELGADIDGPRYPAATTTTARAAAELQHHYQQQQQHHQRSRFSSWSSSFSHLKRHSRMRGADCSSGSGGSNTSGRYTPAAAAAAAEHTVDRRESIAAGRLAATSVGPEDSVASSLAVDDRSAGSSEQNPLEAACWAALGGSRYMRKGSPLLKAIIEQHHSMLLNHGEHDKLTTCDFRYPILGRDHSRVVPVAVRLPSIDGSSGGSTAVTTAVQRAANYNYATTRSQESTFDGSKELEMGEEAEEEEGFCPMAYSSPGSALFVEPQQFHHQQPYANQLAAVYRTNDADDVSDAGSLLVPYLGATSRSCCSSPTRQRHPHLQQQLLSPNRYYGGSPSRVGYKVLARSSNINTSDLESSLAEPSAVHSGANDGGRRCFSRSAHFSANQLAGNASQSDSENKSSSSSPSTRSSSPYFAGARHFVIGGSINSSRGWPLEVRDSNHSLSPPAATSAAAANQRHRRRRARLNSQKATVDGVLQSHSTSDLKYSVESSASTAATLVSRQTPTTGSLVECDNGSRSHIDTTGDGHQASASTAEARKSCGGSRRNLSALRRQNVIQSSVNGDPQQQFNEPDESASFDLSAMHSFWLLDRQNGMAGDEGASTGGDCQPPPSPLPPDQSTGAASASASVVTFNVNTLTHTSRLLDCSNNHHAHHAHHEGLSSGYLTSETKATSFELGNLRKENSLSVVASDASGCRIVGGGGGARSSSMETRSPISVTLTRPNNENELVGGYGKNDDENEDDDDDDDNTTDDNQLCYSLMQTSGSDESGQLEREHQKSALASSSCSGLYLDIPGHTSGAQLAGRVSTSLDEDDHDQHHRRRPSDSAAAAGGGRRSSGWKRHSEPVDNRSWRSTVSSSSISSVIPWRLTNGGDKLRQTLDPSPESLRSVCVTAAATQDITTTVSRHRRRLALSNLEDAAAQAASDAAPNQRLSHSANLTTADEITRKNKMLGEPSLLSKSPVISRSLPPPDNIAHHSLVPSLVCSSQDIRNHHQQSRQLPGSLQEAERIAAAGAAEDASPTTTHFYSEQSVCFMEMDRLAAAMRANGGLGDDLADNECSSGGDGSGTSGYLGFHEKLDLYNKRLREQEAKDKSTKVGLQRHSSGPSSVSSSPSSSYISPLLMSGRSMLGQLTARHKSPSFGLKSFLSKAPRRWASSGTS